VPAEPGTRCPPDRTEVSAYPEFRLTADMFLSHAPHGSVVGRIGACTIDQILADDA